jgi:hypothetical protein
VRHELEVREQAGLAGVSPVPQALPQQVQERPGATPAIGPRSAASASDGSPPVMAPIGRSASAVTLGCPLWVPKTCAT